MYFLMMLRTTLVHQLYALASCRVLKLRRARLHPHLSYDAVKCYISVLFLHMLDCTSPQLLPDRLLCPRQHDYGGHHGCL